MTAGLNEYRPRVAVDTNVLMEPEWLRRLLLASDRGLLDPIWSPQMVGELARAGLWRLGRRNNGRRSITVQQYEAYRRALHRRIRRAQVNAAGSFPVVTGIIHRPSERFGSGTR